MSSELTEWEYEIGIFIKCGTSTVLNLDDARKVESVLRSCAAAQKQRPVAWGDLMPNTVLHAVKVSSFGVRVNMKMARTFDLATTTQPYRAILIIIETLTQAITGLPYFRLADSSQNAANRKPYKLGFSGVYWKASKYLAGIPVGQFS
jgi:hypothetical protein